MTLDEDLYVLWQRWVRFCLLANIPVESDWIEEMQSKRDVAKKRETV